MPKLTILFQNLPRIVKSKKSTTYCVRLASKPRTLVATRTVTQASLTTITATLRRRRGTLKCTTKTTNGLITTLGKHFEMY